MASGLLITPYWSKQPYTDTTIVVNLAWTLAFTVAAIKYKFCVDGLDDAKLLKSNVFYVERQFEQSFSREGIHWVLKSKHGFSSCQALNV